MTDCTPTDYYRVTRDYQGVPYAPYIPTWIGVNPWYPSVPTVVSVEEPSVTEVILENAKSRKRLKKQLKRAKSERNEAHRLSALWEEKYHDAEVEIELMIVERDEARAWARRIKAERDEARANQIKSRCDGCLHYAKRATVCRVTGQPRSAGDYCSHWEEKP